MTEDRKIGIFTAAISALAERCGANAKAKGFNAAQHRTQIAMIATEVAEALETVSLSGGSKVVDAYSTQLMQLSSLFEQHRMESTRQHSDFSAVLSEKDLYEELADVVIRVMSYAGGNGKSELLASSIMEKIKSNESRPHLHGKAF